ncbi:RdgB/HAM1 family non-canonical purine NTP pyrophosphatase [Sinirhodobacter populi]|uniref:dITP/XTP pyrophosphatase n=2 Tax=Paenirhodobacter populi TaxID=2306993 RepID=A0A443JB87_9RHOB|nr:RdgB/HAM1 family non-canonical purine NTP pyrophosphatase [Sinirhodobacter populi]
MRKFTGKTLLFATHNAGKVEEMRALLAPYGIEVKSNADFNLPEPEETGTTFAENARIKAHAAAQATGLPALSDDSGIEVDALGGAPGVYTADWAETPNGRDFTMAMTKTWTECEKIAAPFPRTARFRSTLVLAWPDGHDEIFDGKVEGQLVWPMRGTHGHGYDPMFQPDGYDITFGEMEPAEKNRISHRANAFRKLVTCFGGRRNVSSGSPYEPKLGYSRAVMQGDWCFVAGTTGADPVTRTFPDSVLDQARNALATIRGVLEAQGFSLSDVVRANYVITDPSYVEAIIPALSETFGEIRPAAMMIVAGLVNPAMKIEIEVTALRG